MQTTNPTAHYVFKVSFLVVPSSEVAAGLFDGWHDLSDLEDACTIGVTDRNRKKVNLT